MPDVPDSVCSQKAGWAAWPAGLGLDGGLAVGICRRFLPASLQMKYELRPDL